MVERKKSTNWLFCCERTEQQFKIKQWVHRRNHRIHPLTNENNSSIKLILKYNRIWTKRRYGHPKVCCSISLNTDLFGDSLFFLNLATGKQILCQSKKDEYVIVYQAYNDEIGRYAAKNKKFEGCPKWQARRMTWFKTDFLWMGQFWFCPLLRIDSIRN